MLTPRPHDGGDGSPAIAGALFRRWLTATAVVMIAGVIALKCSFLPEAARWGALGVVAAAPFAGLPALAWSIGRLVRVAIRRRGALCGACAHPLVGRGGGRDGEQSPGGARRCPECGAVSPGDSVLRRRWAELACLLKPTAFRRLSARAARQRRSLVA